MNQLVSIIIPMYNSEKFIVDTLESIKKQTYSNFEAIIIDDLSTDNSAKLVKSFCESDRRFQYYCLLEKGGASIARNLAIEKANGDYIAFLDADDRWLENKLESQLNFMIDNNLNFTYTNFIAVDEACKPLFLRKSPKKISFISQLFGNDIGCLTVMYNAKSIGKISIPKIDKRNDMALWFKVLENCSNGYLFPEFLSIYVVSEGSLSRNTSKKEMLKYHKLVYQNVLSYGNLKSSILSAFNILNYFKIKIFFTKKIKGDY